MRPTAGTTVRVIGPADFSSDTLWVEAQQMISASAYGDAPVRRAVEDQVLARLLAGLPASAKTLAVLDRCHGQWFVDQIGHGLPGDADYLPPRAWWAYRVTVEIKRSEVS